MKLLRNISLKEYNSFGIDAKADLLIEYSGLDELKQIFHQGLIEGDFKVLSGGNNILFSSDFKGTLLHPVGQGIEIVESVDDKVKVRVESGVEWDDFVAWCVENDLWGAENLSLIPGYVGAAPVQNIGAYGSEVKDIIHNVELFCVETHKELVLLNEYCLFGYRSSIFKESLKDKVVITAVTFILSKSPTPNLGYGDLCAEVERLGGETLGNVRQAVINIRESKLPDKKIIGNAGSFFKNPVIHPKRVEHLKSVHEKVPLYPATNGYKIAAGWLIDQCGWKGFARGTVGVHDKQALVLVNLGGAKGEEILSLAKDIQRDVFDKFGIEIEFEVNIF